MKKTVKDVKMHKFLVCACKSQDFGQSQTNFARSHDRETLTFRNSADFIIGVKFTIFCFNAGLRVYLDFYALDYQKILFLSRTFFSQKKTKKNC